MVVVLEPEVVALEPEDVALEPEVAALETEAMLPRVGQACPAGLSLRLAWPSAFAGLCNRLLRHAAESAFRVHRRGRR